MRKLVLLMGLLALVSGCSDNKSAIEEAQEQLLEVRREAREEVYEAEQVLARAIADSRKNISQASDAMGKPIQTSEKPANSSSVVSGTTMAPPASSNSDYCSGLEVGGVTASELQTYDASCRDK